MVGLMIKKMGQNMRPRLLERLAGCRLVLQQTIQHGFIERGDVPDYAIILIRAGKSERTMIVMDDRVEPFGMVPVASESFKPYAIGHQEMVECSMHALEECTNIPAIIGVTERKRRMVEPSVGPTIVGCELFEVSFHDTAQLHEYAKRLAGAASRTDRLYNEKVCK
jgi:hypothetical protein